MPKSTKCQNFKFLENIICKEHTETYKSNSNSLRHVLLWISLWHHRLRISVNLTYYQLICWSSYKTIWRSNIQDLTDTWSFIWLPPLVKTYMIKLKLNLWWKQQKEKTIIQWPIWQDIYMLYLLENVFGFVLD